MFANHPLLARIISFILLPLFILSIILFFHFQGSLATLSGELRVTGSVDTIRISRDAHGVTMIEAKSDRDAFYAMGFAHAQDRLWQLEIQRRMVQGRLSEVFGKETINQDIWFRTLDLYNQSQSAWMALSDEAQASLTAYKAGVNGWLAQGHQLPIEFTVLGITPQPWSENDSLSWIKLFALNLSGNITEEMHRFVANQRLDAAQMTAFYGNYPLDSPVTVSKNEQGPFSQHQLLSQVSAMLDLQKNLETQWQIGGQYVGSNAWVVSGTLTDDGHSLLANDPHLGLSIPSLWYVVDIQGDNLKVSGMSLVGLPLVVFGKNQHIAWGGTSMMADTQDLYFEHVNPLDVTQYRMGDEWLTFDSRSEVIQVKADFPAALRYPYNPLKVEIRSTIHGPVISDMDNLFEQPVSLKWTALAPGDTTYESFFKTTYATDWASFRQAFSYHVAPTLNMLYTDVDDNIGYLGVGKIPLRNKGQGGLPVPGWDADYQWTGMIPASQMPQSFNPDKGFIVNANNKVVDDDYPYFITNDWAPPERAERIEQLLRDNIDAGKKLTMAQMKTMQADTVNLGARKLLPLLNTLKPNNEKQAQVLAYMAQWDGDMAKGHIAATIFRAWMEQLRTQLFSDELHSSWGKTDLSAQLKQLVDNTSLVDLQRALNHQAIDWCDNVNTSVKESCNQVLLSALDDTIEQLRKLLGSDVDDWSWQNAQVTLYRHTPFSSMKGFNKLFERRISNGGSANSINVAAGQFKEGQGYLQTFGAGFRQIMGIAEGAQSHWYMNSTGQSGNVFSEHYDDAIIPFNKVQYFQLNDARQSTDNKVLTLTPRENK